MAEVSGYSNADLSKIKVLLDNEAPKKEKELLEKTETAANNETIFQQTETSEQEEGATSDTMSQIASIDSDNNYTEEELEELRNLLDKAMAEREKELLEKKEEAANDENIIQRTETSEQEEGATSDTMSEIASIDSDNNYTEEELVELRNLIDKGMVEREKELLEKKAKAVINEIRIRLKEISVQEKGATSDTMSQIASIDSNNGYTE